MYGLRSRTTVGHSGKDSKKRKKNENDEDSGRVRKRSNVHYDEINTPATLAETPNNSSHEDGDDMKSVCTRLFHDVFCESNLGSWEQLLATAENDQQNDTAHFAQAAVAVCCGHDRAKGNNYSDRARFGGPYIDRCRGPLELQASQGCRYAQYFMGNMYGLRLIEDPDNNGKTYHLFKLSADQGFVPAICALGICYLDGIGVPEDLTTGAEMLQQTAERGYSDSWFQLGQYYERKARDTKDGALAQQYDRAAANYFLAAAVRNHAYATWKLGRRYLHGLGVDKNESCAAKYFRKAAVAGLAIAQNQLGDMFFGGVGVKVNYNKMVKWYKEAAKQGHAAALYNMGLCYSDGTGVEPNASKAFRYSRRAAQLRHSKAAEDVADRCYKGIGVTKDYSRALRWYKKASKQGNISAQTKIAMMYKKGKGVVADRVAAAKWFRLAAGRRSIVGLYNLGRCYKTGDGCPVDYIEAARLFALGAKLGCCECKYELALLHIQGLGVPSDFVGGYLMLKALADDNYVNAAKAIKTMTNSIQSW
jgi:TPR repeat protein